MDGSRFDRITRSLASGSSRRGLLKAALASIVATAVPSGVRAAAAKRKLNEVCRKHADCASNTCLPADRTGRRHCGCSTGSDCPAPGICRTPATCSNGSCSYATAPNGTECGGGKTCQEGVCAKPYCVIDAISYNAGTVYEFNTCLACIPSVSTSKWSPLPDNTACASGSLCASNETCTSGVCGGGDIVQCEPLNTCHDAGVCDPQTGICSNPRKEIDFDTDLNNCGSCGNLCSNTHATSICIEGVCFIESCDAGWADCTQTAGACVDDLSSTTEFCGTCGNDCNSVYGSDPSCVSGVCTGSCEDGFTACGNDGCINTQTDVNNCGTCGNVCEDELQCRSGECRVCFVAGTRIAMADGTSRPIELVLAGDLVLGMDGEINEVRSIAMPKLGTRKLYAFNEEVPFVTSSHPFMTDGGWKSIDPGLASADHPSVATAKLVVGDRLHALAGVAVVAGGGWSAASKRAEIDVIPMEIEQIRSAAAGPETQLYNLSLSGNHTYFANDLLVHNKP